MRGEEVGQVLLAIAGIIGGGWLSIVLIIAAIGLMSGKKK